MPKTQEKIDSLRGLRKNNRWYINKGLTLDQEIIEETVKSLTLKKCPVCRGDLHHEDNFGTVLGWERNFIERYCPKDNYIITLESHSYRGNIAGTQLFMKIFTNSKNSKLLADSGILADFSSPYITMQFS